MKKKLADTRSICPVCLRTLPAQRVSENGKVYLEKECPEHGFFRALIFEAEENYLQWNSTEINTKPDFHETETAKGCPHDCGLCPEHKQQACCVVIDVTDRCNQNCAYCFASSDKYGREECEPTVSQIHRTLCDLLKKTPERPFNIQLSGGEPTVREDLFTIIKITKELRYPYIQLNTNGMRLTEEGYCEKLQDAGLSAVFLQFDGTEEEIYRKIRGQELLSVKKKALEEIKKAGLSAVLVVTVVPGVNDENIDEIIRFAAEGLPFIRGIHFQPVSYMGRFPHEPRDEDRITLDGLIRRIEEQTGGAMERKHFLPLTSGSCYCSFHGRFIYTEDGNYLPISTNPEGACCEKAAIVKARNFIEKQWEWTPDTKNPAGGSGGDLSDFEYFADRVKNYGMSITAMGFQDRWNLDLDRLEKCRVHVSAEDGKLIPFCAYNNIYRKNQG